MKGIFFSFLIQIILVLTIVGNVIGQNTKSTREEERPITKFHSIYVGGLAKVHLVSGSTEKVNVKITGIPSEDVIVNVQGGILKVTTTGSHSGETVDVYVTYNTLRSIQMADAAVLATESNIKTDKLSVTLTGRASASLAVDVNELTVEMKDAADLNIRGKTEKFNVASAASKGTLNKEHLRVGKP
jgi:hypothetical protein